MVLILIRIPEVKCRGSGLICLILVARPLRGGRGCRATKKKRFFAASLTQAYNLSFVCCDDARDERSITYAHETIAQGWIIPY